MKVRVLMATLVITLLLGVQGFASPYPCDSACVDPCASCDRTVKCDLFSGLKRLVNGVRINHCDPCEPVVACNPCDVVTDCDPCGDTGCGHNFTLGERLRGLFTSNNCGPCDPCNTDCAPCDYVDDCNPCDVACGPKFSFGGLFKGFRLSRGCDTDCDPCDPCNTDCVPCDPCDTDCVPCDPCDTGCGPRGHLFDLPRISLKKLFGGLSCSTGCDDTCNPCDEVRPCDSCF